MADYSQCCFQYDGKFYVFAAAVLHGKREYRLDNNAVGMFQYVSAMDNMTCGGSLVYTDDCGALDSIFRGGRTVCKVMLYQGKTENEVAEAVKNGIADNRVEFDFMVNSVEILGRGEQTVSYRFNLVSVVMEKCLVNVKYSNFGKDPEPCLDIFKKCADECGMKVDQAQFKKLGSEIKINYMSRTGDDMLSVKRYLFDKMYSYGRSESSMKFVYYDFASDMYRLFDMARPDMSSIGVREIVVSQQQNGAEGMFQSDQIDIGAPASFTQVDQILAFRGKRLWTYNLRSNGFSSSEFSTVQVNGVYNKSPDNASSESSSFVPVFGEATADYNSEWSNYASVYEQLRECLFKCKSIRIEVSGDVYCRVGYMVRIEMDNIEDVWFEDSPTKALQEYGRYRGFGGIWYVQGVHGYFDLPNREFKQVLTLVRSYVIG